ncbi:FecR domain-containing protein [Xylophilus sp.]|uniref:FecR domain-containing protein n=1 Tax=Xylophilus sp. TaxID=2653893 RepID=UPI0013BC8F75|nr:FecR domain-containing protein [Xylophilus sp.]KAF1049572.1 MAG: Protein FecR [Xylophilus sp.]
MPPPAADDPVLDAAVDWMVLLQSGQAGAEDRARLDAWCRADARHARAWERVQGALRRSLEPVQAGAAAQAARAALLRPPRRRRVVGGAVAFAGLALGAGWMVRGSGAAAALWADLRTGTGERRNLRLADGSTLLLDARSAVDVDFGPVVRAVRLRAGALIAAAAADAARSFVVQTAEGSVRALGTRFLVRQEAGRSVALVLEHAVQLFTAAGAQRRLAAWERGVHIARHQPLGEVVDALRPYCGGFIRVSPAAARLRVLGAFPLDEPDRAIESLAQTLPIRVKRYGRWLLVIDAAQEG